MNSVFAAPPGTVISNQAQFDYLNSADALSTVHSNVVDVVTAVTRSPASVELTRVLPAGPGDYQETVGPVACLANGNPVMLGNPVVFGNTVDPTEVQQLGIAGAYNLGESVFVRLTDTDQNVDASVVDYAVVDIVHDNSGDSETIRLSETGVSSGIFAGFLPTSGDPAANADCVLQGTPDSIVRVTYTDPADESDTAAASAMLDPVSLVFESRTGSLIDGATIEIVDVVSGMPALVYGNDGVSIFPSSITSGGTETDSGGRTYQFGDGEYRFPVVPPGSYRLVVTPPATFTAPSVSSIADLQALPGAPYSLGTASFGGVIDHDGPLSIDVDIPVDPAEGALFMQKSTTTTIAAPGDFVRYELSAENSASSGVAMNVHIEDRLPSGLRYISGSATRDDAATPDPDISQDHGVLEFDIGDLAAGESVHLSYVAEIVGGRRNDELVNRATAFADAGLVSNEADATIRLAEDLYRTTSTIIGRIVEGHCSATTSAEDLGVAGIRVYLEDGRFAVSDESGRFHFEGLEPGTHVAQIDPDTVPAYFDVIGCDTAPQYAGRTDSQFVRTHRGSLNRADFYLRRKLPPKGQVDIQLRNLGTESSEQVEYVVTINGEGNVRITNLRSMLMLPEGVSYLPGTISVNGRNAAEPRVVGSSLTISVPDQFGNWTSEIRFQAAISDDTHGELTTRALARFDSPIQDSQQTPVAETRMTREKAVIENEGYVLNLTFGVLSAELSPEDIDQLEALISSWQGVNDIRLTATGHSDSQRISPANRDVFADNYALSRARALAAANYVAAALGVASDRISVEGRGPDDPVDTNATAAGRQANRRVEMVLTGKRPARPSFLEVTKAVSGLVIAETRGDIPGAADEDRRGILDVLLDDDAGMPASQAEPPVTSLEPGAEILLPERGYSPAIPSTKLSIKHGTEQRVTAWLNGTPVNPLNYDGMEVGPGDAFVVSRWVGVDLQDGANEFRVEVRNADGSIAANLARSINFAGSAIRGEVVPEQSVLVADGRTRPIIAVRLYDRGGNLSRKGGIGTFRVDAPYRSWWEVEYERKNEIVAVGQRQPLYRVGTDGIALIELEPTTQAGEARLVLEFENRRQQELRVWLSAAPRDWILVGFAEGTAGYNTLTDNMSAALDAGHDDGYFDEGRVAFFAKGQIRGEYLMTIAYDSDKERDANREGFQTVVDPNAFYTLYADRSEQRFDAASQRKLFLKLERRQFYALFGDYDSGLSVTELARYERRFNGLKSGFRGDNAGYTVFAADTNQSFLRDEIRGDGTSGLYRLSVAPIIVNSETVRIETRDRFDTGSVIESRTLSRFLDYNLDPFDGTIYFKQPVLNRDAAFNPVFIVVEYEGASDAADEIIAGGRASLRTTDDQLEVGVSVVDENQQGAESDLAGFDLRWQVNPETLVRAEIASSSRTSGGTEMRGKAHTISLQHQGENVELRAYAKEVDQDFGLGQQNTAEKGVRKIGVDGRARISAHFYVDGEANWQQNLETNAIRNAARAQLRYENNGFNVTTGLLHASDEFDDGDTRTSSLAEVGVSRKLGAMTLRANGSFELSGDAENADFPTAVVVGADYRVLKGVELFAEYEDASGPLLDTEMARVGVRASPWSRAQVNSSFTSQETEFGPRLFSNVGIVQGFQLNERWALDIGLDQSSTMSDPDLRQFDTARELVSGSLSEDFTTVFIGAAYAADLWTANSRVEYRDAASEQRTTILSGWYREPSRGHGLSAGLTVFQSDNVSGAESSAANLKFGWAWRKAESRWAFLNRTDLVFEDSRALNRREESRRLVNNFNANRRISARTQLSLQYAFKYVRTMFDTREYSGYTDLVGVDFRRGFKSKWDWGTHASVYHSYESDVVDYGFGLDVGYMLRDNLWVTVGYNLAGFHDSDFSRAGYTAEGPYLKVAFKADQHMLKRIANR